VTFDGLFGHRRHARWNLTVDWNIGDSDFHGWSNQRPGLTRVPVEKTFALQRRDVLHHRSLTGEAEMTLDFARAGRDAFFSLLPLDKVEYAFLPLRQHMIRIARHWRDASSNEQIMRIHLPRSIAGYVTLIQFTNQDICHGRILQP
jgi:hypothetical protein